jgi:hypothetical protein
MFKDTNQFVLYYYGCYRNKISRSYYQSTLKPLPLPVTCWRDISVNFIGPLPFSDEFDMIIVVVDRLTKIRHYLVYYTKMTIPQLV